MLWELCSPWHIGGNRGPEVIGCLVLRPGVTVANKPRRFAVCREISELMYPVWVRLPAPEFSRHGPLFANLSLMSRPSPEAVPDSVEHCVRYLGCKWLHLCILRIPRVRRTG